MNMNLTFSDLQRQLFGQQSTLIRFWRWWTGELRQAVPERLLQYMQSADRSLHVLLADGRVLIHVRDDGGMKRIAALDWTDGSPEHAEHISAVIDRDAPVTTGCVVALSNDRVLRRIVELPIDTEERLADVLSYEMDRLTPLSASQVYFDYEVVKRDAANGKIEVQLTVAQRSFVDELTEKLEACGLQATVIRPAEISSIRPRESEINLLPAQKRQRPAWQDRTLPFGLAAIAAILAMVALSLPLVYQQRALDDLMREIDAVRPAAIAVAETRDEIDRVRAQNGFFAARRASSPIVVSLLDELTRVVPDDTWLTRLEVRGRVVRMQGESERASALISQLESSDRLRNATFSSPVTKNPRTSNDRFIIEAEISPATEAAQ